MKRFALLIFLMLFATVANSKPTIVGIAERGELVTITFAVSDSADSDAIRINNTCSVRAVVNSGDVVELRAVSTSAQAASAGSLIASFSNSSTAATTFTAGTLYAKARATASAAGGSQIILNCSNSQVAMQADPYGMVGSYMTQTTMANLAKITSFTGLDPNIPWTHYWINPYTGVDSNPGTRLLPIRTWGKFKTMADFGTHFHIQNGNRDRPMYISNQTFDFPSGEQCAAGETLTTTTVNPGTVKVLDVDPVAGRIVFEDLTGGPITTGTVITTGTFSGTGCSFTVGTRRPTLWDTVNAPLVCDSAPAPNSASCTGRATQGSCSSGQVCIASASASVNLTKTPTKYDQRVVSIVDAEDPFILPVINGNKRTIGDLDNTTAGANGVNRDNGGILSARNNSAFGCLGAANIKVEAVADDNLVQSDEGCVRGLNLQFDRVWNFANAKNNNAVTTHDGAGGRGSLVCVNCTGTGFRIDSSAGPPVAPTGSSSMVLIGTGDFVADATNWNDPTVGSPNGAATSVLGATGGKVAVVGHSFYCLNTAGAATSHGCAPVSFPAVTNGSSLSLARILAKQDKNSFVSATSFSTSGATLGVKMYGVSLTGGRGVAFSTTAANLLSIDVRGWIFSGLDSFYVVDASGAGNQGLTSVNIQGVYNDDGVGRFFLNNATSNTVANARSVAPTWNLFNDAFSRPTTVTEYSTDGNQKCLSTGQCWQNYSESYAIDFPIAVYDYLPVPIKGYMESGTRNFGAR